MRYQPVSPEAFADLDAIDDWRFHLGAIHAHFRAGSFPAATELASTIATVAEELDHHPDIVITYPDRVSVTVRTHATGGLTTVDVDLARRVSQVAKTAAASSEPTLGQSIEITIDVLDLEACLPFWSAVMGDYAREGERLLVDPLRQGPAVCFQHMDAPRPGRNRVHVDVSVPHDVAEQRVDAAIAAGGQLVSEAHARSFWVLADPEGNEACVCTWQDR